MIVYTMVGCQSGTFDEEMFPDGIHEWVATSGYLREAPETYRGAFRYSSGVLIHGGIFRPFRQTYEADMPITGFVVRVFEKYDVIRLNASDPDDAVRALVDEWMRLQEFAREHGKIIPDCDHYLILDHD